MTSTLVKCPMMPQGYNSYILEYGSNTAVGSFLPTAVYSPDISTISINPRGLNFVALRVNATHANFFLEVLLLACCLCIGPLRRYLYQGLSPELHS